LTADTIHIKGSTDYIQDIDSRKIIVSTIQKTNNQILNIKTLQSSKTGLHKLSINEFKGEFTLKVSAKILGIDYPKGICLNTIEQLTDAINKEGVMFNSQFIVNSVLQSIDIKTDLRLTDAPSKYINSLYHLTAPNFTKAKYPEGVTFNENVQQNPIRVTIYSKEFELKHLRNKKFYKEHPNLINYFDNLLRFESRLKNQKTISKILDTTSTVEVLQNKNLNYNIFLKMVNNQTDYKTLLDIKDMTRTELKSLGEIYLLHNQYNGDFDSIYKHIKNQLSSNTKPSTQRKQIIKNMAIINNSNGQNTSNNIKEITTALLNENKNKFPL